jgi:hypothetical protein
VYFTPFWYVLVNNLAALAHMRNLTQNGILLYVVMWGEREAFEVSVFKSTCAASQMYVQKRDVR